jgi:hypothetical protein
LFFAVSLWSCTLAYSLLLIFINLA